MGQRSGGLHHSEGSRPLPHQAGKGLPLVGFENAHDSAVNKDRLNLKNRHMHTNRQKEDNLYLAIIVEITSISACCRQHLELSFKMMIFYSMFMGFLGYFP